MPCLQGPRPIWVLLLALLVMLVLGCQTLRPTPYGADNTSSYCNPPQVFPTGPRPAPDAPPTPGRPLTSRRCRTGRPTAGNWPGLTGWGQR